MENFMQTEAPIRMTVNWIWIAIYAFLFLTSIVMAVLLLAKGQTFGIIFLIFMMVVGFLIKMAQSYVEADDERILVYSPPFGKYAIRWDETTTVETNGVSFALRGEGKALGFNTTMGDSSVGRLKDFMEQQIASRGIVVKQVKFMPRVKPINTRVV
jgi:hypothetical protein